MSSLDEQNCNPSKAVEVKHRVIPAQRTADLLKSQDTNEELLVIDCRSFCEFNTNHIRRAVNVTCSKVVKRRLHSGKLSVSELLKQLCRVDSSCVKSVLVYDHCTEILRELPTDSFTVVLMSKLINTFKTVLFLRGGFLKFHSEFPAMCEKTVKQCSQPLTSLSQPAIASTIDIPATKILPFLYLGTEKDAFDLDFISAHGITHILNVSNTCTRSPHVPEVHFKRIPVNDAYNEKLLPHMQDAFNFFDKVRESGGVVLVHCLAGISRSPTLSMAYLMSIWHIRHDEAYKYVKQRRPIISPNFNFMGQLVEYESLLFPSQPVFKRQRTLDSLTFHKQPRLHHSATTSRELESPSTAISKLSFASPPCSCDDCLGQQFPSTPLSSLRFTACKVDPALLRSRSLQDLNDRSEPGSKHSSAEILAGV